MHPPVYTGCEHKARTRPAMVVIACADANFSFGGLKWRTWAANGAVASGVAHENDCTPNCAAGHFHAYPGTLRLSHPVTCVKGRVEFSTLSWTFRGRSDHETLPCGFLRLHA